MRLVESMSSVSVILLQRMRRVLESERQAPDRPLRNSSMHP